MASWSCVGLLVASVWLPSTAIGQVAPIRFECDLARKGYKEKVHVSFVYLPGQDTALMVGNSGTSDVLAFLGSDVLSFVEVLKNGSIATTTIDQSGKAIYSRHTYINRFLNSQWTGTCTRS